MKNSLWEEFFQSMMCFKKLESAFSLECEMQMNEMAILQDILGGCSCSEKAIVREIDAHDRRKISISTTPEGRSAAMHSRERCEAVWTELLENFGEDNMRTLIDLLNTLNELSCSLGLDKKK